MTNSSEDIFDPTKLEKLLVKDWINFINPRNLLNFLRSNAEIKFQITNPKIQTLMVSNCELKPEGISLWINYNIVNSNSNVNITDELLLEPKGTIRIINTI